MKHLDHIVLAARSLAEGVAHVEALTGIRASPGGRHTNGETENALLSLGDGVYLEIVAPQAGAKGTHDWVAFCRASATPRILTYAMRSAHTLAELAGREIAAGRPPDGPYDLGRERADGALLAWKLLDVETGAFDRAVPFFIDWKDSEHPSLTAAPGARLLRFIVRHPDAAGLQERLASLSVEAEVEHSAATAFEALLDTPKGRVSLA
jgi:hypothetical protein